MPRVKPIEVRDATNSEALAGHVIRQMLERHCHIRSQARKAAIQALEQPPFKTISGEPGQKNAQRGRYECPHLS
jgi:hypothetical protein